MRVRAHVVVVVNSVQFIAKRYDIVVLAPLAIRVSRIPTSVEVGMIYVFDEFTHIRAGIRPIIRTQIRRRGVFAKDVYATTFRSGQNTFVKRLIRFKPFRFRKTLYLEKYLDSYADTLYFTRNRRSTPEGAEVNSQIARRARAYAVLTIQNVFFTHFIRTARGIYDPHPLRNP